MPHSLQKMCIRLCKHACATEQLLVCPGHGNHFDPSWNLSSAQKNHQNSRQLMTQSRLSCLIGCDHPLWRWCGTHLASQGLVIAVRNGCDQTKIQFSLIFWRKLSRWRSTVQETGQKRYFYIEILCWIFKEILWWFSRDCMNFWKILCFFKRFYIDFLLHFMFF